MKMLSSAVGIGVVFTVVCACLVHVSGTEHNSGTVHVASIRQSPFLDVDLTQRHGYRGFIADLMEELSTLIRFQYQFVFPRDGQYGNVQANGTWNGLIGMMINREADVAAADLTVTAMADRVVDFTQPFMDVQAAVLVRRRHASRWPINSIADLATRNRYDYGVISGSAMEQFFRTTSTSPYDRMWTQLASETQESSVLAGVNRVMRSNNRHPFALIGDSTVLQYVADRFNDLRVVVDSAAYSRHLALATPLQSSLHARLELGILELREKGKLGELQRRWWNNTPCM